MVCFAGLAALAIAFGYRFLPETKALPVEDIVRLFEHPRTPTITQPRIPDPSR